MEDTDQVRLQIYGELKTLLSSEDSTFEQIEQALKHLKEQGNKDDDNIDKILKVAALKLGQAQTVLAKLEQDKNVNPFMYVYALHSLGKQDQAFTNFNQLNMDQSDFYSNILHAQILYKLDEHDKAYEIFKTLISSKNDLLKEDLNSVLTNLIASLSNVQQVTESDIKAYEDKIGGEVFSDLIFNIANAYSSVNGQEKAASKKLKESLKLAEEDNESDNVKFPILAS